MHGWIILDKPLGLGSTQAVAAVKRNLRSAGFGKVKVGHGGTLDPLATGVLPLCFGAATKFSQLQLDADKTYEAILLLGQKTTTADAEGDVIETRPVPEITPELLAAVTQRFTGPLAQIPPMYSALKKDGKALYEYARAGKVVEREPRHILIHEMKMEVAHDDRAPAAIRIIVRCSKGTYIRTLGEDIGEAIGCGAHLGFLRRIETGGYTASQCISLPALEAMNEAERDTWLLPPQSLVSAAPMVSLDAANAGRFLSGLRRRGEAGHWGPLIAENQPLVQVFGSDPYAFLGTAHVTANELIPERLLSPIEVQDMLKSAAVGSASSASAGPALHSDEPPALS